ncbi:MAG: hypothetical protein Q4A67_07410 [Aerococcus sp.]|nr:hypothetical protein [Aerococcus sp.]
MNNFLSHAILLGTVIGLTTFIIKVHSPKEKALTRKINAEAKAIELDNELKEKEVKQSK